MLGAARATILGSGVRAIQHGWITGDTGYAFSSVDADDDTSTQNTGGWGYFSRVDYAITSGAKVSIDMVCAVEDATQRWGFGVSRVNDISSYTPNASYSTTNQAFVRGIELGSNAREGDIITIELDYDANALEVFLNGTTFNTGSITNSGATWYFGWDEFSSGPAVKLVPSVYAPSSGFTKINS